MRQLTYVLCTLFILSYADICLAQNEVELKHDGIVVPRMATAPANAGSTEGQLYYNTTDGQFEYFDGTAWQPLVTSGGTGSTPYKIEDLVNADTYVLTSDNSAAGVSDVISIAVSGTAGMKIDKLPSNDIRLNFSSARDNTVVGENAGNSLQTSSNDNTFVGRESGKVNTDGEDNVYIGNNAGRNDTRGDRNVFLGSDAGEDYNNTSGSAVGNNVFVGYESGSKSNGTNNTYVGSTSGKANSGNQNVFIGNGAGAAETNLSNSLIIDNNSTNPLIYGEFDNKLLSIDGDLGVGRIPTRKLDIQSDAGDLIARFIQSTSDNVGLELVRQSGATNTSNRDWRILNDDSGIFLLQDATSGTGYTTQFRISPTIAGVDTDFIPLQDDVFDLGSSNARWDNVFASNAFIQTSDMREKKEVTEIDYGLETVNRLRPVSYFWKDGDKNKKIGLIAQEVLEIVPEVVDVPETENGLYGMSYSELVPVLIISIQELTTLIKNQERRITKLELK